MSAIYRTIKTFFIFAIFLMLAGVPAGFAHAGFGITPSFIWSDRLTPGTRFTKVITLVRSDPDREEWVRIEADVPGASSWFSVGPQNPAFLPKGERSVPITVSIAVPETASHGVYRGTLQILSATPKGVKPGVVGIALGAVLDVDISVGDTLIQEMRVRFVEISPLEEGRSWLWTYLPGKIRFAVRIENTGNVPHGPSRVELDIYDAIRGRLLEKAHNTNAIGRIAPFTTETAVVELPTRLPPGSYIARYRIIDRGVIAQENDINISIMPKGSLAGYSGYGFSGLGVGDQLIIIILAIGLFAAMVKAGALARRMWAEIR